MNAPLESFTVLAACTEERTPDLAARLRALGARVVEMPTIRIAPPGDLDPLDRALRTHVPFDWVVFTSRHGVAAFVERARGIAVDPRAVGRRVATVGPATAAAARREGLRVDFTPLRFLTDAIAEGLGRVQGRRVLLPRADIARKSLADALRARGAIVEEIVAYRTIPSDPSRAAAATLRDVDFVVFTSASAAHSLDRILGPEAETLKRRAAAACIGPVTAEAARALGYDVRVVADEYTVPGLLTSLVREASRHG